MRESKKTWWVSVPIAGSVTIDVDEEPRDGQHAFELAMAKVSRTAGSG